MKAPDRGRFCDVLYDQIYAERVDIPFYVELAKESPGPVLEAACGTGRVLIPSARAGAHMVGVDLSVSRLALCRVKLEREPQAVRDRAVVFEGNMCTCDLGAAFTLVTLPFRGFQDLVTPEEQRLALENLRRHLRPGGRLALDLFNPSIPFLADTSASVEFVDSSFEDPSTRAIVTLAYRAARRDYVNQLQDVEEIIYVDAPGLPRTREVRQFTTRYTFRHELEYLLELTGFRVEQVFGDFTRAPFGSQYPGDLVVIARRQ